MTDCPNADIRDALPDLVSGRLSGLALDAVRVHLATCPTCQDEVVIIERARAVLIARTPRVNTQRIVDSLVAIPVRSAPSRWTDWRIAAGIGLIALGGAGLYTKRGEWTSSRPTDTLASAATSARGVQPETASVGADDAELSVAGSVDGLSDDQLRALLDKVGQTEALPSAESRRLSNPLRGVVTPEGDDGTNPEVIK